MINSSKISNGVNKYENLPSLRKYVLTKKNKNIRELKEAALKWTKASSKNKLTYEIDWLGVPIIQTPEDMILMQELIFKIKPDVLIETGIAHGGSLIYYASLLELLGKGKVMGIDIEIRKHNRKVIEMHPLFKRIKLIEGNSISVQTIEKVRKNVPKNSKVIVCLDSSHFKDHVLRELEIYQEFVGPGGYIVVFDTTTSKLAKSGICEKEYINNSPKEAIDEFLKTNGGFEVDEEYNKLFVSYSPNGYLRRKFMPSIYFKDNVCSNYKLQIRRFRDYFIANGWTETNDPKKADIIFVGTCAAFDILEKESLQDLKKMNKLGKKLGKNIIAYGCLTTFNKKGVKKVHRGPIIPAWRIDKVELLIKDPKVKMEDVPLQTVFRSREDYRLHDPSKRFVNICLGCPFNCTYCPHKLGIGPLKSRPSKEIIKQIQDLVREKVKTVVLVGNEVGAYGLDIGATYPKLLKSIMKINPSFDIHVSQLHPAWALKYWKQLLPLLSNPRVSDIQITIQTTSKRLLKLMRRPQNTAKVLDFLRLVRKKNKRAVFRTDILVGFPTETVEELKETLNAVTKIFDEVTIYGFERKKGVPLEKMALKFYTPKEIRRHVNFALKFAFQKDCLVTRGGQVPIKEMKKADKRKEKLYKVRGGKIST